jgi:hypothetical protein
MGAAYRKTLKGLDGVDRMANRQAFRQLSGLATAKAQTYRGVGLNGAERVKPPQRSAHESGPFVADGFAVLEIPTICPRQARQSPHGQSEGS